MALGGLARQKVAFAPTLGYEAFEVAQGVSQSSASAALQQMANRFASGDGSLAGLVRLHQDMLAVQRDTDKAIVASMARRDGQKERPAFEAMRKKAASQLALIAEAWRARAAAARAGGFPFLFAGVNEGYRAGASLHHSHSQLVRLREEPPTEAAEHDGGACRLCEYVVWERTEGSRVVVERDGLLLVCPYAGRAPFECLVAPLEHEDDAFASALLDTALELAADALRRLRVAEGPRPANLWLHGCGHWHFEVLPRLTTFAAIELGTGRSTSTRCRRKRRPWPSGGDGGRRPLGAEPSCGVDRGAEIEALVLCLLDQHHGLDCAHVVDPLLLAFRWNLGLVRPVIKLHLGDARDRADLA